MDIGAEISKKIQMAITAKLKELDAYVDDELPDYIMIMVANKKTESQMTEALSLFLSKNTTLFTSWLHNLLANLRKARSDHKEQGSEDLVAEDQKEIVKDINGSGIENDSKEDVFKPIGVIPANKTEEVEKENTINVKSSKTDKLKTVVYKEPPPAEAIITINAESDDVLDKELRSDSMAITPAEPINKKTEAMLPSTKEIKPTTCAPSAGKKIMAETKAKSNIKRENNKSTHKRKHDNHSRKSLLSSSNKSKTSEETRSDTRIKTTSSDKKDAKESRRAESGIEHSSNRPGSISRKNSERTVVREWDRGKGRKSVDDTISARDKKHQKDRYEEWVELSPEEENFSKIRGSVYSTVNTVAQDPEFISDDSDDDDIRLSAITSKISYPERKMRVPLSKQANKALLIRAVSEAEKSVRRKRSMIADGERKETGLHAVKKRERLSCDQVDPAQKPIRTAHRRFERADLDGRKFIIRCVSNKSPSQERKEISKETKQKKKVILLRKSAHEKHKKLAEPEDEVSTSSKTSKVTLLEQEAKHQPVTVILKRKKRNKQSDVIYIDDSTTEDEPNMRIRTKDKRNFISRDPSPKLKAEPKSSSTVVKFDSRHTEHNADPSQEKPVALKKIKATAKVSPRPQQTRISNQINLTKSSISQGPSQFFVTLDGVAATKTNIDLNKGKKTELVSKGFKFEPVVPPAIIPTLDKPVYSPVQKPVVIEAADTSEDDHEDASTPASNTSIAKMREKLLKVQEEAAKLKRMQARLAAAQAQQNALLKSGGMYADEVKNEQKSIFIGNVHYSTTVKQLSDYFSICGNISRVTILKDSYTGLSKGFAYLEFDDKRAVSSALALDNTRLNNRVIRVTLKSNPPANAMLPPQQPVMRGFHPRLSSRFFGGTRFPYSASRYPPQRMKLPSRNKIWVNPSLKIVK